MRLVAVPPDSAVNLVEVIAFVQPEPVLAVFRRERAVRRNALQRLLQQLEVHAVGASDGDAQGHPTPVDQQAALRPPLAAIGRIGARLVPPERRLGQRPSHRLIRPLNLAEFVVFLESQRPELFEHAGRTPLLEAAMGGTARTDAGGKVTHLRTSALPLGEGSPTEKASDARTNPGPRI